VAFVSDSYATNEQRDRRGTRLAIGGVVTLLGVLYLAGWLFMGRSVPSGTRVADVDIGGLSPDEAAYRLESELADRADDPIHLIWQGHRFTIDPEQAGLHLNVAATVREAGGGRSWNPVRMLEIMLTTGEIHPVIDVDRDAFDATLDRIAKQVDLAPIEPRVTFAADGTHTVVQPVSGHVLDREGVADDIVSAYLRSDDPVQLRINAVQPRADLGDVARAISTYAKPATSGPIRLQLPNRTVELSVPQFAPALSLQLEGDALVPTFDVRRLADNIADLRTRIGVEPRNARWVLRDGHPAIVPSRSGRSLDPAKVAAAVAPVVGQTGEARVAKLAMTEWKAGYTTDDARALGVRRVVSSFTTRYPGAHYRNVNLGRAAKLINGTIIRPGDTFSFNHTVGRPSTANGFTVGYVRRDGVPAKDVGGGVSQVATTVFNAAFFAGLEDVHHQPHRVYAGGYPAGREAIVSWPGIDLRFKNTTPHGVMIQSWIRPGGPKRRGEVHVRMWSTKYWEVTTRVSKRHNFRPPARRVERSPRCYPQDGRAGFDVDVYRYLRRLGDDTVDRTETMHAAYLAADHVVCQKPHRHKGHMHKGHRHKGPWHKGHQGGRRH
jgi:vancomycin resistance protein YoaR